MRRLILEFKAEAFKGLSKDNFFDKLESLDTLHEFATSKNESIIICRVKFKEPNSKVEELLEDPAILKVEMIKQEEGGTKIILLKRRHMRVGFLAGHGGAERAYLTDVKVRSGLIRVNVLGSASQVRQTLGSLERRDVRYKIVSIDNAKFLPESPLSRLTEKQRQVLTTAFKLGYYDLPRKIGSDELAEKLGLCNSTFVAHRRKAERRLLAEILRE